VTKPAGAGIAISMCRSIIEANGGRTVGTTSTSRLAPSSGSRCRCGSKPTFSDPNYGLANTSDRPIETNHASCCDASQDVSLCAPHQPQLPRRPHAENAARYESPSSCRGRSRRCAHARSSEFGSRIRAFIHERCYTAEGRKKSAIHAFSVQGQDRLQSRNVESQCGGAEVIHSTVESSPSDIVTRFCQGCKPKRGSK
jgi:hypothetical protein